MDLLPVLTHLIGLGEKQAEIPKPLDVGGILFGKGSLVDLTPKPHLPVTVQLRTLTGLVDYIKTKEFEGGFLVVSPQQVEWFSKLSEIPENHYALRQARATTMAMNPTLSCFGKYVGTDTLILELKTNFVQDELVAEMVAILGNLSSAVTKTVEDDGFSQTVIVRKNVIKQVEVTPQSAWSLRPWRTFQEISQPETMFVLRFQGHEGEGLPKVALFETGSGMWKVQAIANIRGYLATALEGTGVAIVA